MAQPKYNPVAWVSVVDWKVIIDQNVYKWALPVNSKVAYTTVNAPQAPSQPTQPTQPTGGIWGTVLNAAKTLANKMINSAPQATTPLPTAPIPTSPIVSKPTWETLAKVNDPNKISQFLNSQTDNKFVTTLSPDGKGITGTKNGVKTDWIFNWTDWVVKPSIATSENPVVSVTDATKDTPVPIDTTNQTPEWLKARYLEIASKLPSEVNDEDRRFVNTIKARMSLGETSDQIFGTTKKSSWTTTYSQELIQPWENIASSVKNPDWTYTVTYKDWTTQQTSSKPSETVFPEWTPEYYAQKTAEANQARIDQMTAGYEAEKKKREETTAELVKKYGEDIASQYASQKAEIEATGQKRMETLNSGLSFSGFGRSTMAVEKRDEIAANIQSTINAAKSQADLKLAMYKAQQEGADSEALASMQEGITRLQNGIDDANYKNQLAIIEMNQQNAQTGDAAMQALLGVISNGAEVSADADLEKSKSLGYFVDKQGKVMIDSQGRPIQFEATTSGLDPNQIQAYTDAIKAGILKPEDLDKTLNPAQKADILKGVAVANGTYEWFGQIDVPRNVNGKTNNVGQDTNNPWNIMAESEQGKNYAKWLGAIGFYTSPNGRTYAVFPDMNTGMNAMLKDLQWKISGGSSWANWETTLGKLASGWVSWPNAPLNSAAVAAYVKATGFPANTKIKDIPIETLAKAIYSHEGVDISRNANIPSTSGQGGGGGGAKVDTEIDRIAQGSKWGRSLPPNQSVMLSDATYFPGLLNSLEKSISENKKYFDPLKWIYYSTNPYEIWAQSIEDDLKRSMQLIGKFMEGGVLRKEDEIKYAKMLPKLTDKYEVAQNKIQGIRKMLADKYNGYIRDFANSGYDVSKFATIDTADNGSMPSNEWGSTPATTGDTEYDAYLQSIQ